ncbi:sterol desaturase family protein [Chitinophagaceae bacterium MMS25-I14]
MESLPHAFARVFSITLLRYFVIAGIAFFIFYKWLPARFILSKIQSRKAGKKDFIREILHSMQSSVVLAATGILILLTPLKLYTRFYADINTFPAWWIPVSLLLSLIIHDTYFYWMHRLLHHKNVFNYVHLVHHKSTNPSPWAAYSFHITEAFLEAAVLFPILLLVPMHPVTLILFIFTGFMINVYGHLGYELAPEWFRHSFLFEMINTSVHHNLHHSKFRGNYGLYFRIWDRLMKTEHPDYVKTYDQIQERRFGAVQGEKSMVNSQ